MLGMVENLISKVITLLNTNVQFLRKTSQVNQRKRKVWPIKMGEKLTETVPEKDLKADLQDKELFFKCSMN